MIKNSRPPISRQSSQASAPKSALKRTGSQKADSTANADNGKDGQQLQRRKSEPDLKKALQEKDELARSPRKKLARKSSPELRSATKELRRANSFNSLPEDPQFRPALARTDSSHSSLQRKNSSPILRNRMPERQPSMVSVSILEEPHEEKLFYRHMPPEQEHIKSLDHIKGKVQKLTSRKPRNITKERQASEAKRELARTSVGQVKDLVAWANGQMYRGDLDEAGRPHGVGTVFWQTGKDEMIATRWKHGQLIEVQGNSSPDSFSAASKRPINNATGSVTRFPADSDNTALLQSKQSVGSKVKNAAKDALKWYLADKPWDPDNDE